VALRASTILFVGLALALTAASCAIAAPSADAGRESDKYHMWRTAAVRALSARSDANSLAAAAALSFSNNDAAPGGGSDTLQLISRAAELAPQSAAIGWLHLQLCAATLGCDARDLATVLRWVDPANSAPWMGQLAAAHKDRDSVEVERLLADMARGTRFDLYYNQIIVLMFDALSAARHEIPGSVTSSDRATLTALSAVVSGEIIPPFSPLIDACREAGPLPGRREDCLQLAKIMQRGDTVMVQMVGFRIEKHFVAPDSKEGRNLAERRRLLEWRSSSANKLDDSILPWTQNARVRTRINEMRLRPREEDVCIALLRDRKLPLEPENHP
jgi:hypothetical protein